MIRRTAVLSFVLIVATSVLAFSPKHALLNNPRSLLLVTRVLNSDFEGIIGDDAPGEDCTRLAHEFSEEVKSREQQREQQEKELSKTNRRLLSEDELRVINQNAFGKRRQVVGGRDVVFDNSSSQSAGFFSGNGQSVYSFPLENPNTNRPMRRDEFMLLPESGGTLILPVVIAVALLSLYVAVGIAGGIADGSERMDSMDDWNILDSVPAVVVDSAVEKVVPSVYL